MTAPRFAAGEAFLKDTCGEIARRAAEEGICGAEEFWKMTPREIRSRFQAARAAEARQLKVLDTLAWLTGQYVAVALNAPRRYPAQPNRVRTRATTDTEMRRVLMHLASL